MALKDDRVEQCLRSCGNEFLCVGSKAKENATATSFVFVLLDFQHASVRAQEERSVLDGVYIVM